MKRIRKNISKRKLRLTGKIERLRQRGGWRRFRNHSETNEPPVHDQRGNKSQQTKPPKQSVKKEELVQGNLHRRHK